MTMTRKERLSQLVKRYAGFLYAIAGVLSAMSFVLGQEGYKGASDLPASSTSYLWGALAVCFGLLFWQVYSRMKIRLSRGQVLVGLLFGLVNILGTMLFAYDSWAMLKKPVTLLLTLLKGLGQSLPMMAAFGWLSHLLENGACTRSPLSAQSINDAAGKPAGWVKRLLNWSRRHEGLALWLLFCLCWLPYVLVFYPGTVCWDLGEAAQMFFGLRPMNAWHGVLATWLFGSCIWFGRLFGNDNLGILLYVLMQLFLLAYMAAQMLTFLRRRGLNRRFRLLVLAFFALTPVWGGYVQFVGKDTLYVAALGLFLVRCAEVLLAREAATVRPITFWFCMEIFLCGLLASTIRPNGLIVVLPMALLVLLFGWRGETQPWRTFRVNAAICGLCASFAAIMFHAVLVPGLGITDDTGSAIYSPMFQQSARVLRDHMITVTTEEYETIDSVLDAASLSSCYQPWISDPVKYSFRYYGYDEAIQQQKLAPYRKVWLSMMKRYKLTYAEAFFAGNVSYYSFTPKMSTNTYNAQAGMRMVFENYINQMGDDPRLVHVYQPVPDTIRWAAASYARGWRHIPVLGLLFSCATYTWVLIGAALSLVRQKRRLVLCLFVPALLSLIVCCVSPVNDYFRYFLPIVAMTPLLLGVAVKPQKEEQG